MIAAGGSEDGRGPDGLRAAIVLTPLSMDHAADLVDLANDSAIHRASSVPHPCLPGYLAQLLTEMPDRALHFVVLVGETVAGMTSLKKLDRQPGVGELSYWIGTAFQGRGIATAAARLTVDHAFHICRLARLNAHGLRHGNPASIRVLETLGFTAAGCPDMPVRDRFAEAFPGDHWRFLTLRRPG